MTAITTLTVNPCIDRSCDVDNIAPDRKLRCRNVRREPGGGGINVARVIHKLDGDVQALWAAGGAVGDLLKDLLDTESINHNPIATREMTRENIIVYEASSESEYRFGMPGPEISSEERSRLLEASRSAGRSCKYFVASGSLPPGVGDDFYAALSKTLPDDTRLIVDCSGPALEKSLDVGVFLIKPNLRELGDLVGHELRDDEQVHEAAEQLIKAGKTQVVIASLGAGGAVLVTAEQTEHIAAPTVPVRSRVGAGDSMVGGLVYSLARGDDMTTAARFGVAAGAAAVMTPGTELCRPEDVRRLAAHMS